MRFWSLVSKEFLVLSRYLHGLLVLFVMPAVFILIMSLALRDSFGPDSAAAIEFVFAAESETEMSADIAQVLSRMDGFTLVRSESRAALHARVARNDPPFGVWLGGAADDDSAEQAGPQPELLVGSTVAGASRVLFEMSVTEALRRHWLEQNFPGVVDDVALPPLRAETAGAESGTPMPSAVQQSVPAWLVFSMFFVVIPLSTAFLVERQQGGLLRLRMMNVSPAALIAAKIVPFYAINQVQMVLMVLVGMYLVPRFGGDALAAPTTWGGLWLISSATSFAAIAFALLISTIARSSMEATTMGGVANIIFAALGGVMVPKFVMPVFMQELTVVSPMSWALEGFLTVFLQRQAAAVLGEAVGLLIFGVICLSAAAVLFNRATEART